MGKEKGAITIIISMIVLLMGVAFYIQEDPTSRFVGFIVIIASIIGILLGVGLFFTGD